jgi:hypothetical protein
MAANPDIDPIQTAVETTESRQLETTESEQLSRIKRYDQRIEEWLTSLKDEAGERSPEVLSALASKAQDVADYLHKSAEKARTKKASGVTSSSGDRSNIDESTVGSTEGKETK